jgi:hypothetical protein
MDIVLQNVIFCDSVVPLPDHKIVCYGIFSELSSLTFPFAYPHFSVMASWTNGKGFHAQQTKFLNPSRTLILSQSPEQYFTLENETETVYVTIDVNQVVFTEPGTYYFQIFLDGELAEEVPLHFRRK